MATDFVQIVTAAVILAAMFIAMIPFMLPKIGRREPRGFDVLPVDRDKAKGK